MGTQGSLWLGVARASSGGRVSLSPCNLILQYLLGNHLPINTEPRKGRRRRPTLCKGRPKVTPCPGLCSPLALSSALRRTWSAAWAAMARRARSGWRCAPSLRLAAGRLGIGHVYTIPPALWDLVATLQPTAEPGRADREAGPKRLR